jgi:hypothetical protein
MEVQIRAAETLRTALGAEQLERARESGQALGLDEAVEHALHAAESRRAVTRGAPA